MRTYFSEVSAMKIVIIGAGKVGEELCVSLAAEGNDIVLIEKDPHRLEQLISMADITGIVGNGAIRDTQVEAGVEDCDIFIAVSPHDETNIIGAITAKKIGAPQTIARVRDPEFSSQLDFVRDNMGITLMINPEQEAADEIMRMIEFPSALGIEKFEDGQANVVEVRIAEDSPLVGVSVRELRVAHPNMMVCAVNREDEIIIPGGSFVIATGDHLHIAGTTKDLDDLYVAAKSFRRRLTSALIIGGGKITRYLLPRLIKLKMIVKVIEVKTDKADQLASEFPSVDVVCGDGTNQSFLREEGLENYDTVIALTDIDEENLLLSLFAMQQGAKKNICKVNRTDLLKVIGNLDIDSIITPRRLIADIIIRFVRVRQNAEGSNVDALYRLEDNRVEAIQFHVNKDSRVINKPIEKMNFINNLKVAFIIRRGQTIFPTGKDVIMAEDRIAVVTTHSNLKDIEDILA
jgi:trk system potassium uptake protein